MPDPDLPESFKVLLKEFQALALDIELFDVNGEIIDINLDGLKDEGLSEFSLADLRDEDDYDIGLDIGIDIEDEDFDE